MNTAFINDVRIGKSGGIYAQSNFGVIYKHRTARANEDNNHWPTCELMDNVMDKRVINLEHWREVKKPVVSLEHPAVRAMLEVEAAKDELRAAEIEEAQRFTHQTGLDRH